MNPFVFYMPAKVFFGKDCVVQNRDAMENLGKKALIFTGRNSAKNNGSLKDVIEALDKLEKSYKVFDEVEENPSLETIEKAVKIGRLENVDFIIGIGGGSPMDAAKAASFIIANPNKTIDDLFLEEKLTHLPIVEIPTTAGTGSEVTQFSVVTVHKMKTKSAIMQKVFADVSYLDAKYMNGLSDKNTTNTGIDALTHLIEGYMGKKSNFLSDQLAECGFRTFSECVEPIRTKNFPPEVREKLLLSSTIAGIVIAQAGTSLPHAMGYMPTYEKGIAHGRSNAIFTIEYLKLFKDQTKVLKMLALLGFENLDSFGAFLKEVLDKREDFTVQDVERYTDNIMSNAAKLSTHPFPVTRDEIYTVYYNSLL